MNGNQKIEDVSVGVDNPEDIMGLVGVLRGKGLKVEDVDFIQIDAHMKDGKHFRISVNKLLGE